MFVDISDQMCGPKIVLELYNAPHDQSERLALRFKHAWCFLPQRYASWPYLPPPARRGHGRGPAIGSAVTFNVVLSAD